MMMHIHLIMMSLVPRDTSSFRHSRLPHPYAYENRWNRANRFAKISCGGVCGSEDISHQFVPVRAGSARKFLIGGTGESAGLAAAGPHHGAGSSRASTA